MADEQPLWKNMFDAMEASIRGTSEQWANSEQFSSFLVKLTNNWQSLNQETRDKLSEAMHLANVPAYTDIAKISRQIGALTGRVETLIAMVEDLDEKISHATAAMSTLPPQSQDET